MGLSKKFYKNKFQIKTSLKLNSIFNNFNNVFCKKKQNQEEVLVITPLNYSICSYCRKPYDKAFWCEECDPRNITEGWTSGNLRVDDFIKDTVRIARLSDNYYSQFLEWIPFERLADIRPVGEGGYFKVYSAIWLDGKSIIINNKVRKVAEFNPLTTVALKKFKGSQNMPFSYLDKIKLHWNLCLKDFNNQLKFYGMTKDPITGEFILITEYAERGNLRNVLSSKFHKMLWKEKISLLLEILTNLNYLHKLGYIHKNLHSGNILLDDESCSYISDFGLFGSISNRFNDSRVYGVLPYMAPEILNGDPYSLSCDIFSFGAIMAELSSGKPPFCDIKHDSRLAIAIYDGFRPTFGKGTPEIYKRLTFKCMNHDPFKRPTVDELDYILKFWYKSIKNENYYSDQKSFGYKGGQIKDMFKEADKNIPYTPISYKIIPEAVYFSRPFIFSD